MARGNTSNDATSSRNRPDEAATMMIKFMRGVMETQKLQMEAQKQQLEAQQKQNQMLRQGLLTAQQTSTMALEKAVAPKEPRTGSVANFKRLNPKEFTGTMKPLEAEQWLVDTENLIAATDIPANNQVEVIKIQLTYIARSWWLAEEQRLTKPISWK